MGEPFKGLSIRQPWAGLVACGAKSIELRRWETAYRGPLVVVAGRTVERHPDALRAAKRHGVAPDSPVGVALCLVDLVDVTQGDGPPTEAQLRAACMPVRRDLDTIMSLVGLYSWTLANPRRLKPISVIGKLGLFEVASRLVILA